MPHRDPLTDFTLEPFTAPLRGVETTRDVYVKGTGPGVVVIHEIPGITPEVADFARRVADRGFTVFVPHLFGDPGRGREPAHMLKALGQVCIGAEFRFLSARQAGAITDWLRALCRHAHARCGGRGVGAVGMCFTGNYALSLLVEPCVMAPVLSQPSLPFCVTPGLARAVAAPPEALEVARRRGRNEGLKVIGLRFTGDLTCPAGRFATLRRELGDVFEGHELDSSRGNPWGHSPMAHSVLTNDLIDADGQPTRAALDRVLSAFESTLRSPSP